MRVWARGPSGILTALTPAVLSRRICSSVFAASQPFGGSTSTVVTNSPLTRRFAQFERSSIGVGVNPGAINLEEEIKRFEYKVEAGAEYAITQPVFDVAQLREFLKLIEHVRIPVIAGIWPLVSYRNAEFLHNEVPGVRVTASIMERMRRASDAGKEAARDEGLQIARESLLEVRDLIQGVQVSAPFNNVRYALEVFEALPEFGAARNAEATRAAG
jgi:5,10-methylenetetrahydrofolate reductase